MVKLTIEYLPIDSLTPYEGNARAHGETDVNAIAESIENFDFNDPIGIWSEKNIIVEGEGRWRAAKKKGLTELPCIRLDHLTDEQRRAYGLAHNRTAELSWWDETLRDQEIEYLQQMLPDVDMAAFGFDFNSSDLDAYIPDENAAGRLERDFIIPPFSVLDASQGRWTERKQYWRDKGLCSSEGREDALLGSGLKRLAAKVGSNTLNGTSVFDPVLCEVMYKWFGIPDGLVFDPFAGGAVRGAVAAFCDMRYIGIDLREEQVKENQRIAEQLGLDVTWQCDDSINADKYIGDESADMIMTCPPYADLEKYSDDPRDLSNMEYADFLEKYTRILTLACRKLKENRFAVVVVGDIRDGKGFYRQFVSDTERIMRDAGACLYNEMILVEQAGTLPMRVRKQFNASRKIGKRHQNVLCFFKGDPKTIKSTYLPIEIQDEALEEYIE